VWLGGGDGGGDETEPLPGDVQFPWRWLERKMQTACTQLVSDCGMLSPCFGGSRHFCSTVCFMLWYLVCVVAVGVMVVVMRRSLCRVMCTTPGLSARCKPPTHSW
jgi:hypothetical protein